MYFSTDEAHAVAIDSNGAIVVAGFSNDCEYGPHLTSLAVARFNPDGTFDTSFGGDGIVHAAYY